MGDTAEPVLSCIALLGLPGGAGLAVQIATQTLEPCRVDEADQIDLEGLIALSALGRDGPAG